MMKQTATQLLCATANFKIQFADFKKNRYNRPGEVNQKVVNSMNESMLASIGFWYVVALFGLSWLALGFLVIGIRNNWIRRKKRAQIAAYFGILPTDFYTYNDLVDVTPYVVELSHIKRYHILELAPKAPFAVIRSTDITNAPTERPLEKPQDIYSIRKPAPKILARGK